MEEIWREGPSPFLEEVIAWPNRLSQRKHVSLPRQPVALPKVARGTGGDYVFPRGTPTPSPRNDMIKGQVTCGQFGITILAGKFIAQKNIKAGESRCPTLRDIFL